MQNIDHQIVSYLNSRHGVNLTVSDYLLYKQELRGRSNKISDGRLETSGDALGGGAIVSAIGLSGPWGIVAAVALSAAASFIGNKLLGPKKQSAGDLDNPDYQSDVGFGSTGQQLVRPGKRLPVVFGNRTINPNGGARVGGLLIHNRIDTVIGRQEKYGLYLLSIGQIGNLDPKNTLIGEQPQENFNLNEIRTVFRLGTRNQSVIPEFRFLSQAVKPSGFNELQLQEVGRVEAFNTINVGASNLVNAVVDPPGQVCNNGTLPSGAFGTTSIVPADGGDLHFVAPNNNLDSAIGLSNIDIDQTPLSIEFGIDFNAPGQFIIRESGVNVAGPFTYNSGDEFDIIVVPPPITATVEYYQNNLLIHTSATSPTADLFADISFQKSGDCFEDVLINNTAFVDVPLVEYFLQMDDYDKILTREYYMACTGVCTVPGDPSSHMYFTPILKNDQAETFVINDLPGYGGTPVTLFPGDTVYDYERIQYETTKRVNQMRLNFRWNLHARDEDDGDPRTHGIIYDIFIRRTDTTALSHLIRLYTKGSIRRVTYTMVKIENLELGRHYIEVRPVFCCPDQVPVYKMGDFGKDFTVTTAYDDGVGPVTVTGEFGDNAVPIDINARSDEWSFGADKIDISTESDVAGVLDFVDEIVTPDAIDKRVRDINYEDFALAGLLFHLDTNDQISVLISEGLVIPNYMATGEVTNDVLSDIVTDLMANFQDGVNVAIGWVFENLRTGRTRQIISVDSANQITLDSPMLFDFCDPYVIYFMGSSPYFPDIFTWMLKDEKWGMGQIFPLISYFIDWQSIVAARQWCRDQQYFYDEALINDETLAEWAEKNAVASKLKIRQCAGQLGLVIDQEKPVKMVFNTTNANGFNFNLDNQEIGKFNRLIFTYKDGRDSFDHDGRGRFRPESIVIETLDVYNGIEEPIERRLEYQSITNEYQAIDIACYQFKLQRENNGEITFTTPFIGLDIESGDWIKVQYDLLEKADELSGMVINPGEYDAQQQLQFICLTSCPERFQGCFSTSSPGVIIDIPTTNDGYGFQFAVGDNLDNPLTGASYVVTSIAGGITTFIPAVDLDNVWLTVVRDTIPANFETTAVVYQENGEHTVYENLTIDAIGTIDGPTKYRIGNLPGPLECGSPVIVGRNNTYEKLYEVIRATPTIDKTVKITANRIDPNWLNRSNCVVRVDDRDSATFYDEDNNPTVLN